MRIAIAGVSHETNTYADEFTGVTGRDLFAVSDGAAILSHGGKNTFTGGMVDECNDRGMEIVPLLVCIAPPSGTVQRQVYLEFKRLILEGLVSCGSIDGLVLELHGAGVVEGIFDLEGDLINAIRNLVGPTLPIAAALDLHGSITAAMVNGCHALFGNHLYPHTDSAARGREAVALVANMVHGKCAPVTESVALPILLPPATTDEGHPAARMNQLCAEIESRSGVIDCTVFHGFPFSDTPHVGVHVVCTTDGDRTRARQYANEVARWIWANKDQFILPSHTPQEVMAMSVGLVARGETPVIINDTSDNPGGGTPGDGTHLLGAMISADLPKSCFAMINDAESVEQAIKAGVGNSVKLALGGKHGSFHGPTLHVSSYVRSIADGEITLTHMMKGLRLKLGPSVGVRIGQLELVITSKPMQTFDPEIFYLHGIDPAQMHVVGLKSSQHFRAGFRDMAAHILTADSPGLTTLNVAHFVHSNYPGRLWPIDKNAVWTIS